MCAHMCVQGVSQLLARLLGCLPTSTGVGISPGGSRKPNVPRSPLTFLLLLLAHSQAPIKSRAKPCTNSLPLEPPFLSLA